MIAALIMWLGGAYFAGLVRDDAEVVQTATLYLYIVPVSIGFMGMVYVANASFNALSKPAPPLVLSILRMLGLYIPLAIVAADLYGYVGVFVVTALVNVVFGVAGWRWNRFAIRSMRPGAG